MTKCIVEENLVNWFPGGDKVCACRFDISQYTDASYGTYRIPYPLILTNAALKRRAEYLAGRYCAMKSLQACSQGVDIIDLCAEWHSLWPNGFLGSISHSQQRAVAVTSPQQLSVGVGIDIEKRVTVDKAIRLQNLLYTKEEFCRLVRSLTEPDLLFTLAFSLKESFYKAMVTPLQPYLRFHSVSLCEIDWNTQRVKCQLNQTLNPALFAGKEFEGSFVVTPDSYVVTLVKL
ncbi:MAG: hypothetical protein CML06_14430 [Pseudomonadales bacterium]|nr:hypothetical protein [Pseudomonadales bacterium]